MSVFFVSATRSRERDHSAVLRYARHRREFLDIVSIRNQTGNKTLMPNLMNSSDELGQELAGLICGALLLVLAVAILVVPSDPAYLRATFTAEHIEQLGMFENRAQQCIHRSLVFVLAASAMALSICRPIRFSCPPAVARLSKAFGRSGVFLVAALVVLAAALDGRAWVADVLSFQGRYPLLPVVSLRTQLALAALGALMVYGVLWMNARESRLRGFRALTITLAVPYVVAFALLGILRQPDFSGFSRGLLAGVEWHYSGSVASADRLAIGERLGAVPIHSALLPSVLLGAWQKANGMLDFGGHIRLLAFLETVLLVVTLAGYWMWDAGRAIPWLVASFLVLPWIQPLHAAVLYPNQSAWRFLGFCVGVVLLAAIHARNLHFAAMFLGFFGGLALLWNPETGVCLCLAYAVFLVLRGSGRPSPLKWPAIAASFLGGGLGAAVVFALAVRIGLGYWPDAAAIAGSFPLIGDFSKGYGGLQFKAVDALAVLVFAHALYLAIRGLMDWGAGSAPTSRESCRIALATLVVVWAAYYFKAPDPWNLWSLLFVYGFLLDDLIPAAGSGSVQIKEFGRSFRLMALALVILPAIAATNYAALRSAVLAARQADCPGANAVSGICLPAELAKAERDKGAALRETLGRQRVLYFTADSYLMPLLTGVNQPLPQRDPFSDSILISDFDRLVSAFGSLAPECALFDDPGSPLSGYDSHRKFYGRLRAAIASSYERRGMDRGWEIWCLKSRGRN